jgi:hypothetical protein
MPATIRWPSPTSHRARADRDPCPLPFARVATVCETCRRRVGPPRAQPTGQRAATRVISELAGGHSVFARAQSVKLGPDRLGQIFGRIFVLTGRTSRGANVAVNRSTRSFQAFSSPRSQAMIKQRSSACSSSINFEISASESWVVLNRYFSTAAEIRGVKDSPPQRTAVARALDQPRGAFVH